jgi:hypothetical protein
MGWISVPNYNDAELKVGFRVWHVGGKRRLFTASGTVPTPSRFGTTFKSMLRQGLPDYLLTCTPKGTSLIGCWNGSAQYRIQLYQSWLARNDARDSRRIDDPVNIAKRSINLLEEWRNIQTPPIIKAAPPKECWFRPAEGWMKVNIDGALRKNSEKGGGGVVVRDHNGCFIAGACHFSPPCLIRKMRSCKLVSVL